MLGRSEVFTSHGDFPKTYWRSEPEWPPARGSFHAYVVGTGSAVRSLRRTLHRAGGTVEVGGCMLPADFAVGACPDVVFLTQQTCLESSACVDAWSQAGNVGLVVFRATELEERLRLFDAGADDVWSVDIDPDEAGARARRIVRRLSRRSTTMIDRC